MVDVIWECRTWCNLLALEPHSKLLGQAVFLLDQGYCDRTGAPYARLLRLFLSLAGSPLVNGGSAALGFG